MDIVVATISTHRDIHPTFIACAACPSFGASTEAGWNANTELFITRRVAYKLCVTRIQNDV